jgi:hypothetical protein
MKNPSCLTEPNTSRPAKPKMNTAALQLVHALASPAFNRIMHGNTTSLPAPSKGPAQALTDAKNVFDPSV